MPRMRARFVCVPLVAFPALVAAALGLVACQHEDERCTVENVEVTNQVHPYAVDTVSHCTSILYAAGPKLFRASGETLYFYGTRDAIWLSDGTAVGTRELVSPSVYRVGADSLYVREIVPVVGGALFVMLPPCQWPERPKTSRAPLWWTDDRGNSQMLIGEHQVSQVTLAGDKAFFTATAADYTETLWMAADLRTREVRELASFSATGGLFATAGNGAFLKGYQAQDAELWFSDGTVGGTRRLLTSACSPWGAEYAAAAGGRTFFACSSARSNSELWTSDTTPAGTVPVPGAPTGNHNAWVGGLIDLGGRLAFFYVPDMHQTAVELWITDGTTSTLRLATFTLAQATSSYPRIPNIVFEGKLYFGIGDSLWRSDGTAAGTASFARLQGVPLANPFSLKFIAALRGTIVIVMGEAQVWRVDGDVAERVTIEPPVSDITAFAATPSRIYYAAAHGLEPGPLRALTCE